MELLDIFKNSLFMVTTVGKILSARVTVGVVERARVPEPDATGATLA